MRDKYSIIQQVLNVVCNNRGGTFEMMQPKDKETILQMIIKIISNKRGELKVSQHEVEALAKTLLPDIIDFFNSDEGKKEFAEWQKQKVLEREVEKIAKKKIS